jgi:hypothetical protein
VVGILASSEAYQAEVEGLYGQFLHRMADPSGMSLFAESMSQGMPGELVAMSLLGSDEYLAGTR